MDVLGLRAFLSRSAKGFLVSTGCIARRASTCAIHSFLWSALGFYCAHYTTAVASWEDDEHQKEKGGFWISNYENASF